MIYRISFGLGDPIEIEADEMRDDGVSLTFWRDGQMCTRYRDGDIASVVQLAPHDVTAGEPHARGGAILYDGEDRPVEIYRTEQAARTAS